MGYDRYSRDPDVEQLLDGLESNQGEVFRFMREHFESLSDDGEHILSDEQEAEIGSLAGEKFHISGEEAIKLYQNVSFKISDMHQERIRKEQ